MLPESGNAPVSTCVNASMLISGPAGDLEVVRGCPESCRSPRAIAVLCHPHPLHGGTLRNKVVETLARTLHDMDVATLRFNFRGVGASAGVYAEGRGEADDLRAVLDWAQQQHSGVPLWLAGFSFGAYISLQVAHEYPIEQLITVAPPINFFSFDDLSAPACPWLLVQGEADEIVPAGRVLAWAAEQQPLPAILRMPGVGHFFHGQLNALRAGLIERLQPVA